MWSCDFADCTKPAVRLKGECLLCNRHFCAQHLSPGFHKCPKWEDDEYFDARRKSERQEIERLINKINLVALTERASSLRKGISCTAAPLQYDSGSYGKIMGGMNYHIDLNFSDGAVWLARIRRINGESPPPQVRDMILLSEVATLTFLERTKVPAPKVYDYALEGADNPVGVTYMLQEKMPGRSCNNALPKNAEQRSNLVHDLAEIYIELSRHPLESMGSLALEPDLCVGSLARESLIDLDAEGQLQTHGPFTSTQDYYAAEIRLTLDLILRREMYAQQPVDAYLLHLFLLNVLPQVCDPIDSEPSYYLRHPDDKGDHILVDDDGHITAIIDWEWAYTAPPALAFRSPPLLFSVGEWFEGNNALSTHEESFVNIFENKGRTDLADCVRAGQVHHRLAFLIGYDLSDWKGFLGVFGGLRKILGVDADLQWPEWRQTALGRFHEDRGLQEVLRTEEGASEIM